MKQFTILLTAFIFTIFLQSCGGFGERIEEAREVKDKIETLAKETPAEKDDSFYGRVYQQIGDNFYEGERAFPDKNLKKVKKLCSNLIAYRDRSDSGISRDSVEFIILAAGYESFEEGKNDISRYARITEFKMNTAMQIGIISTMRMMGESDEAEKSIKELKNDIQRYKYTREDIKAMDEKEDVFANAFAANLIINMSR